MPYRNWLHLIAFGGLIATASVHAQTNDGAGVPKNPPSIEEQTTSKPGEGQSRAGEFSIPFRIIETPDQAKRTWDREQKTDKHEADDLEAQQRSAIAAEHSAVADERGATATEWQIIPAWLQLLFAMVGTGALLVTLWFTRRSVKAAINANRHAERQANIAEESFRRLERPYLFLKITDASPLRNPGSRPAPGILYTIVNYGKTPAVLRSIAIGIQENPELIPPRVPFGMHEEIYEVIEAGGEMAGSRYVRVSNVKEDRRFRGQDCIALILHAIISYDDPAETYYHDTITLRGNPGGDSFRVEHMSRSARRKGEPYEPDDA